MINSLPTDTYYRGYRLSAVRQGTPTETVHIYYGTDLVSMVPTLEQARRTIDDWQEAR